VKFIIMQFSPRSVFLPSSSKYPPQHSVSSTCDRKLESLNINAFDFSDTNLAYIYDVSYWADSFEGNWLCINYKDYVFSAEWDSEMNTNGHSEEIWKKNNCHELFSTLSSEFSIPREPLHNHFGLSVKFHWEQSSSFLVIFTAEYFMMFDSLFI
jgi:hypothetical protein